MRNIEMEQSNIKDDPLTRIQREIIEVTERENEFKKVHPTYNRHVSESHISYNHRNGLNGSEDDSPPKGMSRAVSQSHLLSSSSTLESTPTTENGRRYKPQSAQKGIMQRFFASKGRLPISPVNNGASPASKQMFMASPGITPPVVPKLSEGKPIRKGFVPVEEKIQKELKDLKVRESELKRQRKRSMSSYQLDFSSLDLSDKEESELESDEEIPMPGKLRMAKSIGELYEAMGDGRSPSPPSAGASGPESYGSLKPAKSLAQLCELGPDEEALAPSSTKLIAKWESLIQKKQESGAA